LFSGEARAECRTVNVDGARMATVRLLDLQGRELETVRASALAGVRNAQECTEDTRYLLIEYNSRQVLVPRAAMTIADSSFGERPLCPCPGQIASVGDRTAAAPGAGDGICRRNPNCGQVRQ
jgi:hypothetical protein